MSRSNGTSLHSPSPEGMPPGRCLGLTKKGSPCRRRPREDGMFCHQHADQAQELRQDALSSETLDQLEDETTQRAEELAREALEEAFEKAHDEAQEESFGEAEEAALYEDLWRKIRVLAKSFTDVSGTEISSHITGFAAHVKEKLQGLNPIERIQLTRVVRDILDSDILDPDFWEGLWWVVRASFEAKADSFSRHLRGDYEVDDFGMDEEFLENLRPLLNFFYKVYWRVSSYGLENIPDEGRALMAVNHSGVLPFDAAMVMAAVMNEHDEPRPVRTIFLRWFASIPFLNTILSRSGQVVASPENARLLLEADNLVSVFPEGIKGVGKLYKDRYKLARFGRGGFIRTAMETLSPIVPTAVVGAEEIYPTIKRIDWLGKPFGMPYFPLTPTFPALGVFGLIPLPSKWSIDFLKPVKFKEEAKEMADDYLVVALLTEMIRKEIQNCLLMRVKRRRSIWY